MNFDVEGPGQKCTRDRTLIKLHKTPVIMALGISTIILPSNPNQLCDRLKLTLQESKLVIIPI